MFCFLFWRSGGRSICICTFPPTHTHKRYTGCDGKIITTLNYQFHGCALFVTGLVYWAANYSQLGTVCVKSRTMTQFMPTKISKRHAILFGIHGGRSNTNISEYLGVNLKIVRRIRKELERVQWWLQSFQQLRSLTLIILIRKELANFLVRSRPWSTSIPGSQSDP